MKAAVYYSTGDPDVLRYEDVPDPTCGAGEVLVKVEAISIEGGDTLNRAGGEMASVPHIVGYQCAGTISEVGEGVDDRHVGQRVVATMLWGSHAEKVAVPAIITWPIPDGADVAACACVPVAFGTADDCLFEFGHLREGETVLIQAGADVLFAPGVNSAEDLRRLVDEVDLPVSVLAMPGVPPVAELAEIGVKRVSVGGALAWVGLAAVADAAKELRDNGTYGYWDRVAEGVRAARPALRR